MNESCYGNLKLFVDKYPRGVTWFRLKKHCQIIEKHLNPNESIEYVFAGQLDNNPWSFFNTAVLALTSDRLLIAQKKLFVGYMLSSITPDLYNDMQVSAGLFWGTLCVDTVKEKIYVSKLDKKSLPEVETCITTFMKEKKSFKIDNENESND